MAVVDVSESMNVKMIGTANPCPQPERAGTSIAVAVADDTVLVDCGPNATYGLLENDVNIVELTDYFFTHHHTDHNVKFFHLALASWYLGRDELTVYGPAGTEELIDGFQTAYQRHIRDIVLWRHQSSEGLTDIDVVTIERGFEHTGAG